MVTLHALPYRSIQLQPQTASKLSSYLRIPYKMWDSFKRLFLHSRAYLRLQLWD